MPCPNSGRSGTDSTIGRSSAAMSARWHAGRRLPGSRAWQCSRSYGAGLIIHHCGAARRTVAHHAAISARRAAPSLVRMCVMCAEIVLGERNSWSAIWRLVRPAATSWATSNSRALSGCHGSSCRVWSNEAVSRSAASTIATAPAPAAMVRALSRKTAASPRRRARAAACARSSWTQVPSQKRRRACHDCLADSSAWRAADVSPRASRASPGRE